MIRRFFLTATVFVLLPGVFLFAYLSNWPNDEITVIALQSDGKAIMGGKFSGGRILRRNTDGTADLDFSKSWSAGAFNGNVNALAIQSDDRIIAGGEFTSFDMSLVGYIARLNADGSLDVSFASRTGTAFDDRVTSLAIQTVDGEEKVLVGGYFTSFDGHPVNRLARLNRDGSLDLSFSAQAERANTDGPILSLAFSNLNHEIYVGGSFREYASQPLPYFVPLLSVTGEINPNFMKK